VLLRAELDALPIREDTGVDYASTATAKAADGHEVPVDHACGHDMHMACLLGMAELMADHPGQWSGTLIPLFQPAEETRRPGHRQGHPGTDRAGGAGRAAGPRGPG
jgi:hippurate hydrolase